MLFYNRIEKNLSLNTFIAICFALRFCHNNFFRDVQYQGHQTKDPNDLINLLFQFNTVKKLYNVTS